MNMATNFCCTPSITEVLCIHSLVYDEMHLYQTCKMIYAHNRERREWWQHVKQLGGLEFHTTPGMGQYSWNCFKMWRSCELRDTVPGPPDDTAMSNYLRSVELECSTPSSPSSQPESSDETPDFFLDMTSPGGPGARGPMCEQCGIFICVSRSESSGLQCAKCLQSECIDQLISYWGNLHRNHRILSQPTIARNIIEYMFGNGLAAYCSCGTCNPDWFLHGWICCPYVNPPWPWVVPDRNNLAWRRYTRTPLGR